MRASTLVCPIVAALVLSGCSDTRLPSEADDQSSAVLALDRSEIRADVGDTTRLRLVRTRTDAPAPESVRWRVLNPAVALVEDGLVIPIDEGATQVVAYSTRSQASAAVMASSNGVKATAIELPLEPVEVTVGGTAVINAHLTYSNGIEVKLRSSIKWSSLDPLVATVDGGTVTGKKAGTTHVVAQLQSMRDTVEVVVLAAAKPAPTPQPSPGPSGPSGPSELPRVRVDVQMPVVTGQTINVPAGGDLQAAIDAAKPGDEIVLQPGATYVGSFRLRNKGTTSTQWIVIRSGGKLPAPGTRVTPAHAAQMPRLVAKYPSEPVIRTESGAHHYRLIGLDVTAQPEFTSASALVSLGTGDATENTVDKLPHHLVLDRMYIHGHATLDFRRCVLLNSGATAIVDSWLSECHGKGADSQAIVGWNGSGPYRIENNQLEGAGENVMFGGADPKIPDMVPSDIEILRNHFHKPAAWQGLWTVKNLLELKIGRRILIEGNVFENNWADGQVGFAILFKSVNQNGKAPWSQTADVTFRHNVVRNVAHGVNLAANPGSYPAVPAARLTFTDNVFERVGTGDYSGGRIFQVSGIQGLTISRNTGTSATPVLLYGSSPMSGLVMADNIFGTSTSVIKSASGYGTGTEALNVHAPGWVVKGNALIAARADMHPSGNLFPKTVSEVGTMSSLGTLTVNATYQSIGANSASVNAFTAGVSGSY